LLPILKNDIENIEDIEYRIQHCQLWKYSQISFPVEELSKDLTFLCYVVIRKTNSRDTHSDHTENLRNEPLFVVTLHPDSGRMRVCAARLAHRLLSSC
jgi:hypothetical protein